MSHWDSAQTTKGVSVAHQTKRLETNRGPLAAQARMDSDPKRCIERARSPSGANAGKELVDSARPSDIELANGW
jgi:hypothetical protein